MQDFGLFAERDITRAEQLLRKLERFAERRDDFLDHIDVGALDLSDSYAIECEDDALDETIAFGHLYLEHLHQMDAFRAEMQSITMVAA
ncbi:hypothetical protein [Croceibacterium mercuriale]|nr:hypothetical protein [Croceibacterium mercuriale]